MSDGTLNEPFVSLDDPVALRAYAHPLRMALVGLLRREGPMTATQAAQRLGDNVPNCSFHLRQLAKYGLVERVPGADGREKPWRATAPATRWNSGRTDPESQAAVDHLEGVLIARYAEKAREWLARADQEPPEWREHTGPGDAQLYVTAAELAEIQERMQAIADEYAYRNADPASRPDGARGVTVVQFVITNEAPRS
ncbi:winged helix-turn-helix domain-containing protein [Hamadaea tsunoensis]|uniref:winged helix-turn-helix domain-containing protein n=1 Tax=Hamadaea tsunoensis TaxID=53368 RepID=UPI0004069121|nr:helix-turn-helix domain-containing protein [Hamadaea tsunoensis]